MIIILDYGSQYSQLIARRVRECSVYSELVSHDISLGKIKEKSPEGIILSGGPASVYDDNAPKYVHGLLELGIPILGICYGMQLIVEDLGGKVERHNGKREYGKAELTANNHSDLFVGLPEKFIAWMSHGDSCTKLPTGFKKIAHTETLGNGAIENKERNIYGVQFHPEVVHTQGGMDILRNFVIGICKAKPTWTMANFITTEIEKIKKQTGKDNVLLGLSGGVDSTTVAALLHKAIGDQLTCMFIDQGFMRKGEATKIVELFTKYFDINLIHVDASREFYAKVKGVTDPEEKRKRIGNLFIETFEKEAKKLKGKFKYLAQGTLYPDVIESAAPGGSQAKTAVKIKTHHNVGGLPEKMNFKLIEPLRMLFKDEVRKVALELGVHEDLVWRHPFPGPGLAIRILGEPTPERVKILQEADAIMLEEIKRAGLYRDIWQALTVLLPVKSVGVMGDQRTYANACVVRCVTSEDAMTAKWARLPYEVMERISSRIVNEIPEINRVVYDITSKPPGTIEWE